MEFRETHHTPRWLVAARIGLVAMLLVLLWSLASTAGAQITSVPGQPGPISSVPGIPGPAPRAQLVLRHDSLLLIGADGRERFAIADDGTVELSGAATIDFSPGMTARGAGEPAAYVRVRLGGRVFVLQLLTDPDAVDERGPGGAR